MQIDLPKGIKGEMKVDLHLPPEVTALLNDLHSDRELIGIGGLVLIVCVGLCTLKHLLKKS